MDVEIFVRKYSIQSYTLVQDNAFLICFVRIMTTTKNSCFFNFRRVIENSILIARRTIIQKKKWARRMWFDFYVYNKTCNYFVQTISKWHLCGVYIYWNYSAFRKDFRLVLLQIISTLTLYIAAKNNVATYCNMLTYIAIWYHDIFISSYS